MTERAAAALVVLVLVFGPVLGFLIARSAIKSAVQAVKDVGAMVQ